MKYMLGLLVLLCIVAGCFGCLLRDSFSDESPGEKADSPHITKEYPVCQEEVRAVREAITVRFWRCSKKTDRRWPSEELVKRTQEWMQANPDSTRRALIQILREESEEAARSNEYCDDICTVSCAIEALVPFFENQDVQQCVREVMGFLFSPKVERRWEIIKILGSHLTDQTAVELFRQSVVTLALDKSEGNSLERAFAIMEAILDRNASLPDLDKLVPIVFDETEHPRIREQVLDCLIYNKIGWDYSEVVAYALSGKNRHLALTAAWCIAWKDGDLRGIPRVINLLDDDSPLDDQTPEEIAEAYRMAEIYELMGTPIEFPGLRSGYLGPPKITKVRERATDYLWEILGNCLPPRPQNGTVDKEAIRRWFEENEKYIWYNKLAKGEPCNRFRINFRAQKLRLPVDRLTGAILDSEGGTPIGEDKIKLRMKELGISESEWEEALKKDSMK